MKTPVKFLGPAEYRLRSAAVLSRTIAEATARRLLKGPRHPQWNWAVELGTAVMKKQMQVAFGMKDVNQARNFLDSIVLDTPATSRVKSTEISETDFSGAWIIPRDVASRDTTVLYLHGGGYSFYPKTFYGEFIALFAEAARSNTFALDYRLTPQYRFPAQLQDALAAYRWLLNSRIDPAGLIVAGDSAGGNLAFGLILSLRDLQLPMPALLIALSPPTDFTIDLAHRPPNAEFDWVNQQMLVEWGGWFCDEAERKNPLISPMYANLRGLPPIYIQDGGSEILHDSIYNFVAHAKTQGADITLESWAGMNHDFQFFGKMAPQSMEALRRIGAVIEERFPLSPGRNPEAAKYSTRK